MNITNKLLAEMPLQLTSNTVILAIIAVIAVYIFIKAVTGLIKIAAIIGICWFILMSIQSTNIINIPVIKDAYVSIEKIIPSKELWTEALDKANKINKVVNDLK